MSHIAFDLDALPLVPKVARSAGIGEAVVGWGLTQMWEWCWREKTDKVTINHLLGFFGADLGAVLVDFGFLEATNAAWRVRGAARYLRIQDGRIRGGKAAAAAGNLKRGLKRTPAHAPASPSLHQNGPQPTSQDDSRTPPAYIQPTSTPAPAAPQLIPSCPPAGSQHTSQLRPRLSATSDERLAKTNNTTPLVLVDVEPTPPAREVFEHWRKATGKARAVLDQKRRDLIDRRLAEGNRVEDLKAAIDGYAKSPWHNGENDRRRKFLALELMLRDAEHIEAGMDLLAADNGIAPKSRVLTGSEDPYAEPTETANG